MILQRRLLMGERYNSVDQFGDWRLDIDNMSYEQLPELGEKIGYVDTGLKEDEMGLNIKRINLTISNVTSKNQVNKKCTICQLSHAGGRLIIAFDGIWDALSSEMAAKSCHCLPFELTAMQVVKFLNVPTVIQQALRTRGPKDDTTCIVADIISPDNELSPAPTPKKQNKLRDLLSCMRSRGSSNKVSKNLSAINIVEEL
ncbi:unnamed protein product [Lupinus luteus]|uniref:RING-type E3 ubiquitin transferase n=1 Tax=Lupinus luteus TaxID=3873 RepID=A0AAV1YF98_LUPLU